MYNQQDGTVLNKPIGITGKFMDLRSGIYSNFSYRDYDSVAEALANLTIDGDPDATAELRSGHFFVYVTAGGQTKIYIFLNGTQNSDLVELIPAPIPGPAGPVGPAGPAGAPGAAGAQGIQGISGLTATLQQVTNNSPVSNVMLQVPGILQGLMNFKVDSYYNQFRMVMDSSIQTQLLFVNQSNVCFLQAYNNAPGQAGNFQSFRIDTYQAGGGTNNIPIDWAIQNAVKMRLQPNGNVGIGTTAPAEKLEVAGVISSTTGGVKYPDGSVQLSAGEMHAVLVYSANTVIDFNSTENMRTITLTGDVTFSTANKAVMKSRVIRIICDGTTRNFTWPASWVWMGSVPPVSIAAGKTGILSLACFGGLETDVVAAYTVQL